MAKDKSANLPALVPELITVGVNLDKDDVAAILMSRAEDYLKSTIKTCQRQETALNKDADGLQKQLEKQLQEVAEGHFEETIDMLKATASVLKAKSIEACVTNSGYRMRSSGRNGHAVVQCALSITGQKPRICFEVSQDVRMPAAIKTILTAITAKDEEIEVNKKVWMDNRRKLADLPTLERRAKAAVAEQRLKATVEGAELVEMLEGQLDESIKLLGVS